MPRSPAYAAKASPLLDALKAAYPYGLSPTQVEEHGGKNSSARVEELRRDGWKIKATLDPDSHRASYRLLSKTQEAPAVIHAGITMRWDTRAGWTVRTHQEALKGSVSPKVLAQAQEAALAAYKAVLDKHLPAVQVEEDDFDFGLGAFMDKGCGQ